MIFKRLKDHVYICTQFWYVFDKIQSFEGLDLLVKRIRIFLANGISANLDFGTLLYPFLDPVWSVDGSSSAEGAKRASLAHVTRPHEWSYEVSNAHENIKPPEEKR